MNRLLLLLPLALLTTVPHAAAPKNRVGFVDVPQLLSSVAGSADYLTLRKNIDADLTKREKALQTLATKANQTRSAADRNAFAKAQQDYVNAQKGYQTRLAAAFKPLASKIDGAIATAAKNNGYSVVLDKQVAGRTKLVVYANNSATDLTAAAQKLLKK